MGARSDTCPRKRRGFVLNLCTSFPIPYSLNHKLLPIVNNLLFFLFFLLLIAT